MLQTAFSTLSRIIDMHAWKAIVGDGYKHVSPFFFNSFIYGEKKNFHRIKENFR